MTRTRRSRSSGADKNDKVKKDRLEFGLALTRTARRSEWSACSSRSPTPSHPPRRVCRSCPKPVDQRKSGWCSERGGARHSSGLCVSIQKGNGGRRQRVKLRMDKSTSQFRSTSCSLFRRHEGQEEGEEGQTTSQRRTRSSRTRARRRMRARRRAIAGPVCGRSRKHSRDTWSRAAPWLNRRQPRPSGRTRRIPATRKSGQEGSRVPRKSKKPKMDKKGESRQVKDKSTSQSSRRAKPKSTSQRWKRRTRRRPRLAKSAHLALDHQLLRHLLQMLRPSCVHGATSDLS